MDFPLKSGQRKVLQHLRNGKSVFGLMPTGYGKSRCFQEPAFRWGWKVIVVSPLISLMDDQVLALRSESEVYALHSYLDRKCIRATESAIESGDWRLLYLSPERLSAWRESGFLDRIKFKLLVIDEMHCVDTWAEFRSGYKKIGCIVKKLSEEGIQVLGLTATLPAARGRSLLKEWCGKGRTIAMPLGRENLATYVIPCERYGEKFLALTSVLSRIKKGEAVLIYCASRNRTEELADVLGAMGFPAVAYHAGLPREVKAQRVVGFRAGRLPIVCATSAFGMGIDHRSVRAVVHFDCPDTVEGYWQEAGRAGRNQMPAVSLILWTRSDLLRMREMDAARKREALRFLNFLLAGGCRKRALELQFGMRYRSPCGGCNHCFQEGRDRIHDLLFGVEALLQRKVWWLTPEAQPQNWIPRFLEVPMPPELP